MLSNSTWSNLAKRANTEEFIVVELTYDDESAGKELYLSEFDFALSSDKYHGVITNNPAVRESVDYSKLTSKVSNISITCTNIQYQGASLSSEIFGGSHKYINRTVTLYSCLDHGNSGGWLERFKGRLTSITPDLDKGTFTLSIESKTPFDLVSVASSRIGSGGYYPAVYGTFTQNTSKPGSEDYCTSMDLFPVEVYWFNDTTVKLLSPRIYTSGARLHTYDEAQQAFIPLVDTDGNYQEATDSGLKTFSIATDLEYGWKFKPFEAYDGGANTTYSDPENAIDKPTVDDTFAGTYATCIFSWISFETVSQLVCESKGSDIPATTYTITVLWENTGDTINTFTLSDSGSGTTTLNSVATGTHTTTYTVNNEALPAFIYIDIISGVTIANDITVKVYDVQIKANVGQDSTEETANALFRKGLKILYCSGNGIQDGGWIDGATDINEIHDIHRDLLYRHGGITATPEGWSDIDTARRYWDVRLWQHKPVKLTEMINKLQLEGCFVYHTKSTGEGIYFTLNASYSAGDVDKTFTNDKVTNIKLSHIALKDVVTKWTAKSNPNPADDGKYLSSYIATSANRTTWGFTGDENIEDLDLDYLVTTDNSDTDISEFTDYREQISGTIVQTVTFNIDNLSDMLIEIGDIVKFSGIITDPFGDINSIYWKVSKVSWSKGKMSITALEVG
jgi:hypothetical protein